MQTVKQADKWGCGIACLAMLSGKSYEEAKKFMLEQYPQVARTKKISSGKIVDGFDSFGIRLAERSCQAMKELAIDDLPRDALVGVRLNRRKGGATHWVVWDHTKRKVRDPWPEDQDIYPVKYLLVGVD